LGARGTTGKLIPCVPWRFVFFLNFFSRGGDNFLVFLFFVAKRAFPEVLEDESKERTTTAPEAKLIIAFAWIISLLNA